MAKVFGQIKNILSAFLNLIYPKRCQGCGLRLHYKNRLYLCRECLKKIKLNRSPFCIKCGRPVAGAAEIEVVCGKCTGVKYDFDRAFFCCNYEGLIKELIHKFKYNHKKFLIYLFDELMANFAKNYIDINNLDMVVPVPLHRGRLQQRGFDQSLLLSRNLSKVSGLPLAYNILARNRDTRQQTGLSKKQRLDNIKGAFSVKDKTAFDNKRVLLIDDVLTTTATANECAAALKEAGAKSVALLTLAKGLQ